MTIQNKIIVRVFTVFALVFLTASVSAANLAALEYTQFDGKRFKIEDHKGKPVIVGFWATWCGRCKKELPWVNKHYKNSNGEFEVIMISLDDTEEEARKYLESKNYTFPAAWRWEKDSRDNLGKVTGTPTAILIDQEGYIAKRTVREIPILEWKKHGSKEPENTSENSHNPFWD